MKPRLALVLSCEHGGNRIPRDLAERFVGAQTVLASHRGLDIGALDLARHLARRLGTRLHACEISRLVIDLNRSRGNPALFSRYTRSLVEPEKDRLLDRTWRPHRQRVEAAIRDHVLSGRPVLHLAVHTFTPVLHGRRRKTDVGLLHDPARVAERRFCRSWQADLRRALPGLAVHLNAPYRGTSDGFGMALRPVYRAPLYLAVEIEVNQRFARRGGPAWTALKDGIAASLGRLLGRVEGMPPGTGRRDPRNPPLQRRKVGVA